MRFPKVIRKNFIELAWKTCCNVSNNAYDQSIELCDTGYLTLKACKYALAKWSGIFDVEVDCYREGKLLILHRCYQILIIITDNTGCIAYTSAYEELDACPFCKCQRRDANGVSARYKYIPLEHRIRLLYAHEATASLMCEHRNKYKYEANTTPENMDIINDIWAGSVMRSQRMISLFSGDNNNDRAIALQFFLDSVYTHKTGVSEIWPLICLNLNLPPAVHFREDNILPFSIISGPRSPCNLDSFLHSFINEMKQLSDVGVPCYDARSHQ